MTITPLTPFYVSGLPCYVVDNGPVRAHTAYVGLPASHVWAAFEEIDYEETEEIPEAISHAGPQPPWMKPVDGVVWLGLVSFGLEDWQSLVPRIERLARAAAALLDSPPDLALPEPDTEAQEQRQALQEALQEIGLPRFDRHGSGGVQ